MENIEIWKDVKSYEGIYQVSDLGRIKSLERKVSNGMGFRIVKERILKQKPNKKLGYYCVNMYKDTISETNMVHKLVAIAFLNHIPCGYDLVINHKDLNKLNNYSVNLEIITMRENCNLKHIKSSSVYVGVGWNKLKNKWTSVAYANGKSNFLGYFTNEHEASIAYNNFVNRL